MADPKDKVRLRARPGPGHPRPIAPGTHRLGLGGERDGVVSVPPGYRAGSPVPLLVLLHGAGGHAASLMPMFQVEADAARLLVLAPDSRGGTWDGVLGTWGPDVAFLDAALDRVFSAYSVQSDRIALGGFSDGASYALSLGIANGDLFGHILAFSPGFAAPLAQTGRPRIFMSHGKADAVLPVSPCSRSIYRLLVNAGYYVLYREFEGGHSVPPQVSAEAFEWWLAH